jgi:hypothetical protein
MKTAFILLLSALSFTTLANQKSENKSQIVGSWKFTKKTKTSEFQKVFDNSQMAEIRTEYLTFEGNSKFKHEFLDKDGTIVRTLKGKWKAVGEKIKMEYADVDYDLMLNYFFLENDLILGQHFNHIIFTKDNLVNNVAMK